VAKGYRLVPEVASTHLLSMGERTAQHTGLLWKLRSVTYGNAQLMVVTLHLQTGLTAQKPVEGESRLGLAPVLTLLLNILEKTAPSLDQTMRRENVTPKNAQWMVGLHHFLTSHLVARLVGEGCKHACVPVLTLCLSLAAKIVLEITLSHGSAILNPVQLMEVLMNGVTIPNVLLLVVVETRCACGPALTQCPRMEENLVWVLTLRAENAILNLAQAMVAIHRGVNSHSAVQRVVEACNREQEHAPILLH